MNLGSLHECLSSENNASINSGLHSKWGNSVDTSPRQRHRHPARITGHGPVYSPHPNPLLFQAFRLVSLPSSPLCSDSSVFLCLNSTVASESHCRLIATSSNKGTFKDKWDIVQTGRIEQTCACWEWVYDLPDSYKCTKTYSINAEKDRFTWTQAINRDFDLNWLCAHLWASVSAHKCFSLPPVEHIINKPWTVIWCATEEFKTNSFIAEYVFVILELAMVCLCIRTYEALKMQGALKQYKKPNNINGKLKHTK